MKLYLRKHVTHNYSNLEKQRLLFQRKFVNTICWVWQEDSQCLLQ